MGGEILLSDGFAPGSCCLAQAVSVRVPASTLLISNSTISNVCSTIWSCTKQSKLKTANVRNSFILINKEDKELCYASKKAHLSSNSNPFLYSQYFFRSSSMLFASISQYYRKKCALIYCADYTWRFIYTSIASVNLAPFLVAK